MDIAAGIAAYALAIMLVTTAIGKLTQRPQVVVSLSAAGVRPEHYLPLASLEILAAIGLVLSLWWPWVGIAAAIGVVVYFIGAVSAHVRMGDRNLTGAGGFLALGAIVLILQLLR